jgi:hypothetical protein
MTGQDYFETADTNIGAWLLTNKIGFRGAHLSKDGYTSFRFKPDARITDLIDDFNAGGECSAKDFAASYKFLIGQIKQARRSGGNQ